MGLTFECVLWAENDMIGKTYGRITYCVVIASYSVMVLI